MFKDARSVSLYPYKGHKSCNMLSILKKLTLPKALQQNCDKKCVFGQKVKTQQQQNKYKNACRS